jgi:tetratricopeptide (TPR) repeat protein
MFFDFPSRMPATLVIGWTCLGLLAGMEDGIRSARSIRGDGQPLLVLLAIFTLAASWSLGWRTLKGDFFRVQGGLAVGAGDYSDAKAYYEIARENLPWEDEPWLQLHWLYRREFKTERALEAVQGHLARNPWYYLPMKNEKECLMQLGRWEDARASACRILETYPRHPHARWLRNEVGLPPQEQ